MLISVLFRLVHTSSATFDCLVVNSSRVIHAEGNVANTVTVLAKVGSEFLVVGVESGGECVIDVVAADNMGAVVTATSFEALHRIIAL